MLVSNTWSTRLSLRKTRFAAFVPTYEQYANNVGLKDLFAFCKYQNNSLKNDKAEKSLGGYKIGEILLRTKLPTRPASLFNYYYLNYYLTKNLDLSLFHTKSRL